MSEWISVKDQLPPPIENDGDGRLKVLTIDKHGDIDVLRWDWMDWENMGITHWMPLPEPPKEQA